MTRALRQMMFSGSKSIEKNKLTKGAFKKKFYIIRNASIFLHVEQNLVDIEMICPISSCNLSNYRSKNPF